MKLRSWRLLAPYLSLAAIVVTASVAAGKRPPTNGELVAQERDEFSAADDEMNAAYQKLLGILTDDGKTALREAQRKWLAWRDAQAEFDAHQLKGGKLWQMELNGSNAQLTKTRTAQLLADWKRFADS